MLAQKNSYSINEVNEIIEQTNQRIYIMSETIKELKGYFADKAGEYLKKMLLWEDCEQREFDRGSYQTYSDVVRMIDFKLKEAHNKMNKMEEDEE